MNIKREIRYTILDIKRHPGQWILMFICSVMFGAMFAFIMLGSGKHPFVVWFVGIGAGLLFLSACSDKQ